eukprot:scaffold85846_cov40-Cyclotella_meneghiniana.AAC.7
MVMVDPADLLLRHRHLLERDFRKLGEGATVDRKLWLQQMRSAISATNSVITENSTRSRNSAIVGMVVAKYDSYWQLAGVVATKRSNMAKRCPPTTWPDVVGRRWRGCAHPSCALRQPQNWREWSAMMSARGLLRVIGDSGRWGEAVGVDGGIVVAGFFRLARGGPERRESNKKIDKNCQIFS